MINRKPNETEIDLKILGWRLSAMIEAESNITRKNVQSAIRLTEEIQRFGFPHLSVQDELESLEDVELIGIVLRDINRARRWGF